jgi:AcrR family transcriptional regulator
MKKRLRLSPETRKRRILDAAIELAIKHGYDRISSKKVAHYAGVNSGLIFYYFGNMAALKREVMRVAIEQENIIIIAQGLVAKDPLTLKASNELKQKATANLA